MKTADDIGGVVKYHRKRACLTQQELARLAGVGKTAVFDLEKGKQSIQLDTLRKILRALNISIKVESPLMEEYVKKVSIEKS
jgi:HTH-type transcriptional regulator / antitoxin HipB